MSAPVFRLKGSGWYETDFKADKENKRNLAGADKEEAKTETKVETPRLTRKPTAKPDAKAETAKAEKPKPESPRRRAAARARRPPAKPKTKAKPRRAKGAQITVAVNYARRPGIDSEALARLAARERETFRRDARRVRAAREGQRRALAERRAHALDARLEHAASAVRAQGARRRGRRRRRQHLLDFCFGDTGSMFGHSPPAIARALAETGAMGITSMLPAERVARVGEKLAKLFGLPFWQMTQTATDANRAALRWARAITGRARMLVFDGCYHGTVEETMVRALPDRRTRAARARAPASSA